jgi:hypothetical protein
MEKIKCKICGKEYSIKGIGTHMWRNHGDGLEHKSPRKAGFESWNKGLTKETDNRVKTNSESLSKSIQLKIENGTYVPNRHSSEFKKNLSIRQSLHNKGGRSKWFKVNGKSVQGTWERDLAILMTNLKIDWFKPKVNSDIFNYHLDNRDRSYTPDFYLKDLGIFIELKGYWWGNDKEKIKIVLEQNPILKNTLKVIEKENYLKLLKVDNKDDFIKILKRL